MKEPESVYFNLSHCEILLAYLEPPADKYIQNYLFLAKQWIRVLFGDVSMSEEKGFVCLFASCFKKQLIRAGNDPDVRFSPLNHHFSFNYLNILQQTETFTWAEALKPQ